MKPIKTETGFKVTRTDKQKKREAIKSKTNPTNKEIAELLEMILEKLEVK